MREEQRVCVPASPDNLRLDKFVQSEWTNLSSQSGHFCPVAITLIVLVTLIHGLSWVYHGALMSRIRLDSKRPEPHPEERPQRKSAGFFV